jgi:hypothetical protein
MSQYDGMKIAGLKLELRRHHLQISGNKAALLKRLTDFLNPPQEDEEKRPERQKQSQKQIINIYTDGKVDSSRSNAKNIYINPFIPVNAHLQNSIPLPQNVNLPFENDEKQLVRDFQNIIDDSKTYVPFLPSDNNPAISSSSGLKESDILYPMPKKPVENADEDSEEIKEIIARKKAFEEKLLEKKNENPNDEMITYRKKNPDDAEYPYSVIKKKNIKKK